MIDSSNDDRFGIYGHSIYKGSMFPSVYGKSHLTMRPLMGGASTAVALPEFHLMKQTDPYYAVSVKASKRVQMARSKTSLAEMFAACGVSSFRSESSAALATNFLLDTLDKQELLPEKAQMVLSLALQGYPDDSFGDGSWSGRQSIQTFLGTTMTSSDALRSLAKLDPVAADLLATEILNNQSGASSAYRKMMLASFADNAWRGAAMPFKKALEALDDAGKALDDLIPLWVKVLLVAAVGLYAADRFGFMRGKS